MLKLVQKCTFFDIDYDDGKVFVNKFSSTNNFFEKESDVNFRYRKLLGKMLSLSCTRDRFLYHLCGILEDVIYPTLKKIYEEVRRRGLRYYED